MLGNLKNNGLLCKEENQQRGDSKTKMKKDGWGWRRLKTIKNDDCEKFSHSLKKYRNDDIAAP